MDQPALSATELRIEVRNRPQAGGARRSEDQHAETAEHEQLPLYPVSIDHPKIPQCAVSGN